MQILVGFILESAKGGAFSCMCVWWGVLPLCRRWHILHSIDRVLSSLSIHAYYCFFLYSSLLPIFSFYFFILTFHLVLFFFLFFYLILFYPTSLSTFSFFYFPPFLLLFSLISLSFSYSHLFLSFFFFWFFLFFTFFLFIFLQIPFFVFLHSAFASSFSPHVFHHFILREKGISRNLRNKYLCGISTIDFMCIQMWYRCTNHVLC